MLGQILFGLFFAFLPAMLWLCLFYSRDLKDPEPKKVIAKTFLLGSLAALPFLGFRALLDLTGAHSILIGGITQVIVFAMLEETTKISAAITMVMRHKIEFNQITDGIMYAVSTALGFAFIENTQYFILLFKGNPDIISTLWIVTSRSLGTLLAHALFSGLNGLLWAYAYFSKQITPLQQKHLLAFEIRDLINREIFSLHIVRHNILKGIPSRRGGHEKRMLVFEGMVLATGLHVLYNTLTTFSVFGKNLTFLLVPLLMSGLLWVLYLMSKKWNQKILKVI